MQCKIEGVNGALHSFHQIDCHYAPDALLAACLREADVYFVVAIELGVFFPAAWQYVVRRPVYVQIQLCQLFKDLIIVYRVRQVGEMGAVRNGRHPFGEFANSRSVIVFFNMLSGSCYRNAVQNLEEVKVQHLQKIIRRAVARLPFAPGVKRLLRVAEYIINGTRGLKFTVNERTVTLIGQLKLVFQIIETRVHRRGGEHQHLSLDAFADNLLEKGCVAVIL